MVRRFVSIYGFIAYLVRDHHIIVDLDGTLAKVNTFRLWTISAFLRPNVTNSRVYLASLATFLRLYALRAAGRIDHNTLKRKFIYAWGARIHAVGVDCCSDFNDAFATMVSRDYLNATVLERLEELRTFDRGNGRVVLATAAPAFYAKRIASHCGFECIASPIDDALLAENPLRVWKPMAGLRKCRSVRTLLGARARYTLFTDHVDDWPLMVNAEAVYLVNPSSALKRRATSLLAPVVRLSTTRGGP